MSNTTTKFLIIISLFIASYYCMIDLNSVDFFTAEICSYNGSPTIITDTNGTRIVQCKCSPEYDTDPNIRTINGNPVQCSYKKKRRFTALFYSLLLPFGVSSIYLRNYLHFFINFTLFIFGCCGSLIFLAREEKYHQYKTKQNTKERDQTWSRVWTWVFRVYYFAFFSYWLINFLLIVFGIYNDGNGFPLYDDLNFLKEFFLKTEQ